MTNIKHVNEIQGSGLRYKTKAAGSMFESGKSFGYSTKSCYLCGKHRLRANLTTKKYLGKSQAVCDPGCAQVDELLAKEKAAASSI